MNKKFQIILILVLLFGILLTYNNCQGGKKTNSGVNSSSNSLTNDNNFDVETNNINISNNQNLIPAKFETTTVNISSSEDETSIYGVRNRESLLKSMSLVTGVPFVYDIQRENDTIVQGYNTKFFDYYGPAGYTSKGIFRGGIYNEVYGNLPIENGIDKFNNSNLNSIFSLAQNYCEELFTGNHPVSGISYLEQFNKNIYGDIIFDGLNSDLTSNEMTASFVDLLFEKFIPHVTVSEENRILLANTLDTMLDKYNSLKNDLIGFFSTRIFTGANYTNMNVSLKFYETNVVQNIVDFNNNWFFSLWVFPNDYINGITKTGNQWPFASIYSGNTGLAMDFTYSGHSIQGKFTITDSVTGVIRHKSFYINNGSVGNLKSDPYHIAVQYSVAENAVGYVDMENDFKILINGLPAHVYSSNWIISNPISLDNTIYDPANKNASNTQGVYYSASRELLLGHIELLQGKLLEYQNDSSKNIFFNAYGDFTYPKTDEDLTLRDPVMYVGVGLSNMNDVILKTKTSYMNYNYLSSVFTINGMVRTEDYNRARDNTVRNYQRDVWELPYVKYGPLICSTVLSSHYFIFY